MKRDEATSPTAQSVQRGGCLHADAYLFDIDGTLLTCRDSVHYNAFRETLRQIYGVGIPIENVTVHGSTDVIILRDVTRLGGVTETQFREGLPAALELLARLVEQTKSQFQPEAMPGARDLLAHLKQRGALLGIVSGGYEPVAWAKLEAADLRPYFAFGSFSGTRETRAQIFAHGAQLAKQELGTGARICFVGDTPSDVAAAHELRLPAVALASGIYDAATLAACGPAMCLNSCAELLHQITAIAVAS